MPHLSFSWGLEGWYLMRCTGGGARRRLALGHNPLDRSPKISRAPISITFVRRTSVHVRIVWAPVLISLPASRTAAAVTWPAPEWLKKSASHFSKSSNSSIIIWGVQKVHLVQNHHCNGMMSETTEWSTYALPFPMYCLHWQTIQVVLLLRSRCVGKPLHVILVSCSLLIHREGATGSNLTALWIFLVLAFPWLQVYESWSKRLQHQR